MDVVASRSAFVAVALDGLTGLAEGELGVRLEQPPHGAILSRWRPATPRAGGWDGVVQAPPAAGSARVVWMTREDPAAVRVEAGLVSAL